MAPTGVFSSWETLATKSFRTSSVRVISVRSSASRRMYSSRDHGRPHLHHDGALAQRAARQFEEPFEDDAVAPHLGGHLQQLFVDQGVAADQAVGVGGGAGPDDAVDRVHHHEGAADGGEHLGGALGKGRILELDVHELALLAR